MCVCGRFRALLLRANECTLGVCVCVCVCVRGDSNLSLSHSHTGLFCGGKWRFFLLVTQGSQISSDVCGTMHVCVLVSAASSAFCSGVISMISQ